MVAGTRFFNRPRGRFFGVKDERRRIDAGMEDFQQVFGTTVLWYFYDPAASDIDDIYDEGLVTGGRRYEGPARIPVLSAVPTQGQEEDAEGGFASYDEIDLVMSYEQVRRAGLDQNLVRDRELKMLDRFVYRNRVFNVDSIQTSGHFEQTSGDTVLRVHGSQMRPDELIDAPEFQRWSA